VNIGGRDYPDKAIAMYLLIVQRTGCYFETMDDKVVPWKSNTKKKI
jgi:hypothetical protein